jgi:hypothetical protein
MLIPIAVPRTIRPMAMMRMITIFVFFSLPCVICFYLAINLGFKTAAKPGTSKRPPSIVSSRMVARKNPRRYYRQVPRKPRLVGRDESAQLKDNKI